jgi:uncharacterized membrane protein
MKQASVTARNTRTLALVLTVLLVVLGLAWELWLAPTGAKTLALKVLPLAWVVLGLATYRLSTYRWLSLLVWLYVAEGLMRGASETGPSAALAWFEVALALSLFATCVAHVRHRVPKKAKVATSS